MEIAFVQAVQSFTASATNATGVTRTITDTAGHLLVVCVRAKAASITFTCADSEGNTYQTDGPYQSANVRSGQIFYVPNIVGGSNTVTVKPSSTIDVEIIVLEFSGAALTSVLNATSVSTAGSGQPTGVTVTNGSNGLVVGFALCAASGAATGTGAGWVVAFKDASNNNGDFCIAEYIISTGNQTAKPTFGSPIRWQQLGASFKPAGIAFDAASNSGYQAASASYSWSHTCTGTDRGLAVDVSLLSVPGTTVTGITYNGVALIKVGAQYTASAIGGVECWFLANPASGPNTIAVTLSASVISSSEAVSYTSVNQIQPTESFAGAFATNVGAADATVNVVPTTDNTWVHGAVATTDSTITANQTSRNNVTGAGGSGGNEDGNALVHPAGSTATSWTNVGALMTWAVGGYAIRPDTEDALMAQSCM